MGTAATLLRAARRDAGLTMAELAQRAGTSKPTISRYENGLVDPRAETLARLLRACGHRLRSSATGLPVSVEELRERFRGTKEPTDDDVTLAGDGTAIRTADDLRSFTEQLRSEGLLEQ